MSVKTIVITGGPCGGKTTALSFLKAQLGRRGWSLVLVPECATSLIAGGISPSSMSRLDFQTAVFELQLAQEDVFLRSAANVNNGKVLVVCDRGLMDGKGYLSDEEFDGLLASHGLTEEQANARYGAIFHLQSAAKGQTGAYSLENNASRLEDDPTEAIRIDDRIAESWQKHPHLRIIGVEDAFALKANHLLQELLSYLEEP